MQTHEQLPGFGDMSKAQKECEKKLSPKTCAELLKNRNDQGSSRRYTIPRTYWGIDSKTPWMHQV